jgi:hypothetical protein
MLQKIKMVLLSVLYLVDTVDKKNYKTKLKLQRKKLWEIQQLVKQ